MKNRHLYPKNWDDIAFRIKSAADWKCQECGVQCRRPGEDFVTHKITLTTAHMNHIPSDCRDENLRALCAPCHLRYDAAMHSEKAAITRRNRKLSPGQLSLF